MPNNLSFHFICYIVDSQSLSSYCKRNDHKVRRQQNLASNTTTRVLVRSAEILRAVISPQLVHCMSNLCKD